MTEERKYTDLFFDLDRTLWDFDTNSHETLEELYSELDLLNKGVPSFEAFYSRYKEVNTDLWEKYRQGKVNREYLSLHRFSDTLMLFGQNDQAFAFQMSQRYVDGVANKTCLFPYALEIVEYLSGKYRLHVLTNGFADVQYRKLNNSGMMKFFLHVITSEEAGAHKPSQQIFKFAFKVTGADPAQSLMIGDDPEVDLISARVAGMDQVYVNRDGGIPAEPFTYEVKQLDELKGFL